MIARLRGTLDALDEDHAVIDVGGIGYLVTCSPRTLAALPRPGEAVDLLIETQVREDSITLYGFRTAAERSWFRLLQTVQGVGARVALAVLSVLGPDELTRAIVSQDKAVLGRASGVGPRLAGRITSKLRDRLSELPGTVSAPFSGPATALGGAAGDAVSALVNLGYRRPQAERAVVEARRAEPGADFSDLLRASLKRLSRA